MTVLGIDDPFPECVVLHGRVGLPADGVSADAHPARMSQAAPRDTDHDDVVGVVEGVVHRAVDSQRVVRDEGVDVLESEAP